MRNSIDWGGGADEIFLYSPFNPVFSTNPTDAAQSFLELELKDILKIIVEKAVDDEVGAGVQDEEQVTEPEHLVLTVE